MTGIGVYGASMGGYGVAGESHATDGVVGYGPRTGVNGSSGAGIGVSAKSIIGYALKTDGRLKFAKTSGVATIPAGASSVTVHVNVDVTTASFVILTPAADLGTRRLWYTTIATGDTITVHLSSAASSAVRISWLLLG